MVVRAHEVTIQQRTQAINGSRDEVAHLGEIMPAGKANAAQMIASMTTPPAPCRQRLPLR